MSLQQFIVRHLLKRSILSYALYPISLLFCGILILRRIAYHRILPQYTSPVFIISVGNITAGGSGKTPFTIFLANLLTKNGVFVGVSHRGYKGSWEKHVRLISDKAGMLPDADKAGDEAWLIASRLLGTPVVVGKERIKSIKLLTSVYPDIECIILDDSFQHLKVKHNLDYVVFNSLTGLGNGFVLPAGYLREPVASIANSEVLILNEQRSDNGRSSSIMILGDIYNKPVFSGSYTPDCIYSFHLHKINIESLKETKIMLISGIGNPKGFEETIATMNLNIISHQVFSDHCDYNSQMMRKTILDEFRKSGAQWLLTTEKDFSKLRKFPEFEECLLILCISFTLDKNSDKLLEYVMDKIRKFVKVV